MNTHDIELELPPLPKGDIAADTCPVMWVHSNAQLQAYAQDAIEAVRKTTEKQLAAYNRLVNSMESRLTDLQAKHDELKKSTNPDLLASERAANAILTEELEADRKRRGDDNGCIEDDLCLCDKCRRRGEPVAWHTEDHLTDKSATTYDPVVAERWRVKGWPVSPLFQSPQPAVPVKVPSDAPAALRFAAQVIELYDDATMRNDYMIDSGECAGVLNALADYFNRYGQSPQPTEPVQCPTCGTHEVSMERTCHNSTCSAYGGAATVYEGWKTPPAEPVKTDSAGYTLGPISDGGMDPRNEQINPVS